MAIKRFCEELVARVERAGATGPKLLRADSGFWNTKVVELLERAGWQYSIGVRNIKQIRAAVADHAVLDAAMRSAGLTASPGRPRRGARGRNLNTAARPWTRTGMGAAGGSGCRCAPAAGSSSARPPARPRSRRGRSGRRARTP